MIIKTGIDIAKRKRFLKSVEKGGDVFLQRIFLPQELRQNNKEQLGSVFALKEAVIKALELPHDAWLTIVTDRKQNGKVACSFLDSTIATSITSLDTSISHEGELIVAIAVIILK